MYKIYKFFFIFFIFSILKSFLFAQNILCEPYLRIAFFPFYVMDETLKESQEKEYTFLGTGIAKLVFSNLREKFFLEQTTQPIVQSHFIKKNISETCHFYTLATIEFMEKELPSFPNHGFENPNNPDMKKADIIDRAKNYVISKTYHSFFIGMVILRDKDIKVEIEFVNLFDENHNFTFSFLLDKKDIYGNENLEKIHKISFEIQKKLFNLNPTSYSIKGEGEYQVYVNEISYGRNIKKIFLPRGNFVIEIFNDECKKKYRTNEITNREIIFACENKDLISLNINSNPADSDIFLDEKWIGKTPLSLKVPRKVYRVRISKESFLEQYYMLDLTKNFSDVLFINLLPKSTFRKKNVIANLTFYDISFGFAIQSFFFMGGWIYSNVQKEKIISSVRSNIIPTFLLNPLELKPEQYLILENARKKAFFWHRRSQIFGAAALSSLFLSTFFFYKGIDLDIENNPYKNLSFRFVKEF